MHAILLLICIILHSLFWCRCLIVVSFSRKVFFSTLYVWFDPWRGGKDPFKHLKFLRFLDKSPNFFIFSLRRPPNSVMLITLFLETDHWAQTWQGLGDDNYHDDTLTITIITTTIVIITIMITNTILIIIIITTTIMTITIVTRWSRSGAVLRACSRLRANVSQSWGGEFTIIYEIENESDVITPIEYKYN